MRLCIASFALLSLVLAACGSEAPAPGAAVAGAAVETLTVTPQKVPDEVQFDAALEAVYQSTIAAQTNARVEELPFDVGDYVEKGQVVVRFRATEQQARAATAQAAVRAAEARLVDAQAEYNRVKDLAERDVLSKAALDKATAALKSAQAQLEAARATAREAGEQADYTVVRAPYSGIVVARHIEVGETATVGKPLMTGLSLEHLRAIVEVPQQAIGAVHARKQARVILPDGSSVEATQLRIPPAADAQTHTFRVLVTLPQGKYGAPQTIFPGTLVKVGFVRDEREALLVPAQAVVRRSELTAVYVVDEHNRPALRYVSLGAPTADGRYPVLSGLTAGERIALDPVAAAQSLRAGA
ncbi:efflux RND transporter periplasmic adaptor subunit [Fontimonas sp. SYSU GA230001]|uniref:efflux RND transporter periplasmic adaptor subunit n=1 Tax=Fontimonas sp. SYSU GA230001 TaxID=3142450 RepID=UPI0032B3B527